MFKNRIRAWNLDKKHKQGEMLDALQHILQRQQTFGKKTVVNIRGQQITLQEVLHYFNRKGVRELLSLLENRTTSSSIMCYTPPPTPNSEGQLECRMPYSSGLQNPGPCLGDLINEWDSTEVTRSGAEVQMFFDLKIDIPAAMPWDVETWRLQSLLTITSSYCDTSNPVPGSIFLFYFSPDLVRITGFGTSPFQKLHRARSICRGLDCCCEDMTVCLKKKSKSSLIMFYGLLIMSEKFNFVSNMCTLCLPRGHPVNQAVTVVQQMGSESSVWSMRQALELILDRFETAWPHINAFRAYIRASIRPFRQILHSGLVRPMINEIT